MKHLYFYLIAIIAAGITSCEKTPRPISRISKDPIYPNEFSSIPCNDDFTIFGRMLYGKRSSIMVETDNAVSSSPMLSTYDSNSVNVYKNPEGYYIISLAHETYRNDSLKFYFRYLDWSKNLQYDLQPEDPVYLTLPFNGNQCYVAGAGRFIRSGFITPTRMPIDMGTGKVYLRKDIITGKKEIILCNCKGNLDLGSFDYESFFTGRFTLPK